jgi:hypothetical protein
MTKSTQTENRYAVCIGVNQYQPSARLGTLRFAEKDAKAVHDLLGQSGFAPENLCLLLGEDATLDAINSALSTMILDRPGENDLVVFYFAGHSLPLTTNEREVQQGGEPRSEVFLTSYDFDREKIEQSPSFRMQHALGMERLRKVFFEGEGSRKRLFIFDSCYSGDFYGPTYRDDQTTDPVQGYIRRMLDSKSIGRVALSSCLPIQKAAEDPKLGHGRFTYYLLEGLSGDPEALRRDGCVTAGSLFDYIADKLPSEQRPVLSGVQHDKFELICYPDKAVPIPTQAESEDAKRKEREERLHALLADPSGFSFMRSRLESFVGRKDELAEIREYIAEKLPTGGYVTITGQPGQGKSSIIARLIEIYQQEYGPDNVAFHFIPFNPGPDHQVSLLRSIMARLILKYNLSDRYVDSESRSVLHGYFSKVLAELSARGGQEVIFIDGLDQIEADASGVRDLSFLPNNPPSGVVFVLGTRPDDTLRPLELLKPLREYRLPDLSREDFNLILQHHHVHLDSAIADQLYQAMQGNALFLDLLARELVERGPAPLKELIERLAHNPEHLFSLSIARLKRPPMEWREVIKPALGVLLVAQEPLGVRQIRQILGVDDDRLRDGMERLGGLIVKDQQYRYSLFHLKLAEYLRQDEQRPDKEYIFASDDIEDWHKRLAQWCAGDDLSIIWQDISNNRAEQQRREYARRHYITHLYYARQWQQLFEVLDEGVYGRAKLRFDPGTRLYAQDLHLGRQAAAWDGWTLELSTDMLPRLWHYTFLRCSLASRADRYPVTSFCLLVLLKRKQEALGLAEMLTNPAHKARILAVIADPVAALHERQRDASPDVHEEAENAHLESESVDNARDAEKAEALHAVSLLLQQVEYWVGNEPIWGEVELLIHSLPDTSQKARTLTELALAMERMGRRHDAEQIRWEIIDEALPQQAEQIDQAHPENQDSIEALVAHAMELGKAGRETEAWQLLLSLESPWRKIQWLANLGTQAAQMRHRKQIGQIQQDLKGLLHVVAEAELGTEALAAPTSSLEQEEGLDHEQLIERLIGHALKLQQGGWRKEAEQRFKKAERIIRDISDETRRNEAWLLLVEARGRTRNWREVERLKKEFSPGKDMARFLGLYGVLLGQAGSRGAAAQVLESMTSQAAFDSIVVAVLQDQAWVKLAEEYWNKELWIDAKDAIAQIHNEQRRHETLILCAKAAIQKQRWQEINTLFENMDTKKKSKLFVRFGKIAVQNGLMEEAEDICDKVEEMIDGDKDDQFFYDDKTSKMKLFSRLGIIFERIGKEQKAESILQVVEKDILSLFHGIHKDQALAKLANALAQANHRREARDVIDAIVDQTIKEGALFDLGHLFTLEKHWVEAKEAIDAIVDQTIKEGALFDLAHSLALEKYWREAEDVIRSIEEKETRNRALLDLVDLLIDAKLWEDAERVARSIQDDILQAQALNNLAVAFATEEHEIREKEQTEEHEMQEAGPADQPLPHIEAGELVLAGARAEKRIPREPTRERGRRPAVIERRALSALPALATSQPPGESELIQSLRKQWLKAETEEQALEHFMPVCEFVSHYPPSGIQLWEAFKSVNTFLEALAFPHTPLS